MASLRDSLDRFRPVAAPGAPGRRGVPADRAAERESELAPLFAALAETESAAEAIRAHAVAEADRLRQDARQRAEALVADATARTESLRADTAARGRATADRERERAHESAREVAEQVRLRSEARLPGFVARATAHAMDALDRLGTSPVGPP